MFDQFKALGSIAGLMKDKDRLRQVAEAFKEKAARMSVAGEAGGGAVRVTVSGKLRITDVHLDPALIAGLRADEGNGREMAQALILDATNDALDQAQQLIHDEARRTAEDLGLPDLPGFDRLLG